MARARTKKPEGRQVRLKPADPFELIRWLARSQSDPRKAVAELVQNSLDAGARQVRVVRRRVRSVPLLVIEDDGQGVIPEMSRDNALQYLATHVGHSRKLGLTPSERAERVIAGQYGVGLLGFWAIGRMLELRTRVDGSELLALRLVEDKPTAEIVGLPVPLDAPATFTEVVISDLHPAAQRLLSGRRLADYLAAELRGQLLLRAGVAVTVTDRMARGTAQQRFEVVPRRFVGEQLSLPAELPVAGYPPARVELHYTPGDPAAAIQIACAGTLVADDIRELQNLGIEGAPWVGQGLSGLIDFAAFKVPPGTRRGVMPDEAALGFTVALEQLKPLVEAELARLEQARQGGESRDVVRDLRRALRGFRRRLPQYEMPVVAGSGGELADGGGGEALAEEPFVEGSDAGAHAPLELFGPGPLAVVRIEPTPVTAVLGAERRVRAIASDADQKRITAGVTFTWAVEGAGLDLRGEGVRPAVYLDPDAALDVPRTVRVTASQGDRTASAMSPVKVVEESEAGDLGIPEPEWVNDPAGLWRSRLIGERWQVNESHEDFVSLRSDARGRLRYLVSLLAKELVQRSYGRPGDDELLERMVEILAHAERNLRGK